MKTRAEIANWLLSRVRNRARTLWALIQRGLFRGRATAKPDASFRLRRASFKGNGLQAEFSEASWESLRDLSYEGRGGSGRPSH